MEYLKLVALLCLSSLTLGELVDQTGPSGASGASGEENASYPQYKFGYAVHDPVTGDVKSQQETRNGDAVDGSYSVVDPDGYLRTVRYHADDVNGFQVIVDRTPINAAPHDAFPAKTLSVPLGGVVAVPSAAAVAAVAAPVAEKPSAEVDADFGQPPTATAVDGDSLETLAPAPSTYPYFTPASTFAKTPGYPGYNPYVGSYPGYYPGYYPGGHSGYYNPGYYRHATYPYAGHGYQRLAQQPSHYPFNYPGYAFRRFAQPGQLSN